MSNFQVPELFNRRFETQKRSGKLDHNFKELFKDTSFVSSKWKANYAIFSL